MTEKLLKAERVAEFLDVSIQRVYELTREGRIPVIKLGVRQYRFSSMAIAEWAANGGNQHHESTEVIKHE